MVSLYLRIIQKIQDMNIVEDKPKNESSGESPHLGLNM